MNKFEATANLANFLMETKGSTLETWKGHMSAKQQRELFGMFLGKGEIVINGTEETIKHVKKVCFGMDYDVTFESAWANINKENNQNE